LLRKVIVMLNEVKHLIANLRSSWRCFTSFNMTRWSVGCT